MKSPEQIYKSNRNKSIVLKNIAPVFFVVLLLLGVIFLALTLKNSLGNLTEIVELLDKDKYSRDEIRKNYSYLVEKWGEMELMDAGMGGIAIKYVNIKNAVFSGMAITYGILAAVFLVLSVVVGRVLLPFLSKMYDRQNKELVDLTSLQSAAKIDKISKNKEWF